MKIDSSSEMMSNMAEMINSAKNNTSVKVEKNEGFSQLFKNAVDKVNDLQSISGELKTSYELGEDGVDLAQVMIASQKAGLSFQAMVEVRNRMVSAYQEVMRMQI